MTICREDVVLKGWCGRVEKPLSGVSMIFGFNDLNYCRKITGSGGNSIGFIMFFVFSLF